MDAPKIRYVRAADGASLATATIGSGPPLLMLMPTGLGSIEATFATPDTQRGLSILAEHFTFITYDPRGQGLSEREISDYSLEARVADLAAVIDGLALSSLNLLGRGPNGATALVYAATHPDRVQALALWAATARGRDFRLGPKLRTIAPLIETDWPLYCQILALIDFGWTDAARISSEYLVKSITPETFSEQWLAARQHDATEYVGQVRCPTLVVHQQSNDARRVSFEAARALAVSIAGAEFRTGESLSLFAFVGP
jgi:pimeloyl-ACP methyl ester carboxylesterase